MNGHSQILSMVHVVAFISVHNSIMINIVQIELVIDLFLSSIWHDIVNKVQKVRFGQLTIIEG